MPTPQIFDAVKLVKPNKNKFNLSHSLLTTTDFGKLQPIQVLDCLPGDEVTLKHEFAVKFAPLIGPIMSEVDVKMFTLKVPYRLIWKDFEDFISGGEDGDLVINRPKINLTGPTVPADYHYIIEPGSLADALEFPTTEASVDPSIAHSCVFDCLPFRAYWKIFNEYFRDQNLEEKVNEYTDSTDMQIGAGFSTADIVNFMSMAHIAWKKDYFTSALPWTQRGQIAKIPISVDEISLARKDVYADFENGQQLANGTWTPGEWASGSSLRTGKKNELVAPNVGIFGTADGAANGDFRINLDNFYGYGPNVVGTINDLRAMYAIQRWYERSALGGSRYIEQINVHFGVKSSDGRLQRPEFLGASSTPLIVNEVLQNSQSTDSSPLGQPAGHAFAYNNGDTIKTFCEEHCFIITLMAVVPKAVYYQGMPRKYMRDTKEEFYWPEFAHLGEDSVYKGELFYLFTGSSKEANLQNNKRTFGYQSRYADYKFSLNRIAGDFKRSPMTSWHLARTFSQQPVLNSNFIRVDATRDDLSRIWAYEGADFDKMWFNIYNHVFIKRPIPVFSTPI